MRYVAIVCYVCLRWNMMRVCRKRPIPYCWWLEAGLGTPFFSVLFSAVRYVLFRSKKRVFRSFPFFSRVFGDL